MRALRRRRQEAEQVNAHEQGLYLKLAGERLELLQQWEPIDVREFHQFVSSSILEMCSILQELKAPGVAQPGGHLEI